MTFRHVLIALVCVLPARAAAQTTASQPPADAIRVYLDCGWECDGDFTRTEIKYVNWVRDRADAHVHIIVSRQTTGGGGDAFMVTFTGRKNFAGREDTLRYNARSTDTRDIIRRGLTRVFKIGLVPFLAATAEGAEHLDVTWSAPAGTNGTASNPPRDPWNYWVFSVNGRSNFDGESSQRFASLNGNVSANRTTDAFKIRVGFNGSYRESRFTYDPGTGTGDTTVISIRKSYSTNVLAVKSYGGHWSAGLQSSANSATFGNIELGVSGGPALEYSLWPYSEATRRSLTFRYSAGVISQNYRELTIYGREAETHPRHSFNSELNLKQKFGSVSLETDFTQYLHNTSFYNASVFANASINLFKGFSLNFYGNYVRVHDQLSLAASDLTPEEVLLQQKQLRTDYRYFGGFGIGYRFGSIFNNVVNPRFGEGGGSVIFF